MSRLALALVLTVAVVGGVEARVLCAVGDSTTAGYRDATSTVALPPPAALQALLRRAPLGHPWRFARVRNLGVSASSTVDWLTGPSSSSWICGGDSAMWPPHQRAACDTGQSLLAGVAVRCDGWLMLLGLNDWIPGISVSQSADNLTALAAAMPGPVWIGAPTHVTADAGIEARRTQLHTELLARGLLSGIDPPPLPLLADGIHPNDAGAAALGGLWFGILR
jgi:lysophospholipase L1-like esterase